MDDLMKAGGQLMLADEHYFVHQRRLKARIAALETGLMAIHDSDVGKVHLPMPLGAPPPVDEHLHYMLVCMRHMPRPSRSPFQP